MKSPWKSLAALAVFLTTTSLAHAGSGSGAGNGQLLVKSCLGGWVTLDAQYGIDTRTFTGLTQLPTGDPANDEPIDRRLICGTAVPPAPGHTDPFNRPYGREFVKWLEFLDRVAPTQARSFRDAAKATDFVYVNRELAMKVQTYEGLAVSYREYRVAAAFFKGKVYVSIPEMERITAIGGLSREQHQGMVLVTEVINVIYFTLRDDPTRVNLRNAIKRARMQNWESVQYLAEAALIGFPEFWVGPETPMEIKRGVIQELIRRGRGGEFPVSAEGIELIDRLGPVAASPDGILSIVRSDDEVIQYAVLFTKATLAGIYGRKDDKAVVLNELYFSSSALKALLDRGTIRNTARLIERLRSETRNLAHGAELSSIADRLISLLSRLEPAKIASDADFLRYVAGAGRESVIRITPPPVTKNQVRALYEAGKLVDLAAIEKEINKLDPQMSYLGNSTYTPVDLPAFANHALRELGAELWLDPSRSIWSRTTLEQSARWPSLSQQNGQYLDARSVLESSVKLAETTAKLRRDGVYAASFDLAEFGCIDAESYSCTEPKERAMKSVESGVQWLRKSEYETAVAEVAYIKTIRDRFCAEVAVMWPDKCVDRMAKALAPYRIGEEARDANNNPRSPATIDVLILGGSDLAGTQGMQRFRIHYSRGRIFRNENGNWNFDPNAPLVEFLYGPNDRTAYRRGQKLPISLLIEPGIGSSLYVKRGAMIVSAKQVAR